MKNIEKKEITIYDIAKKLNVSPATVSRGLNNHPAINKKTKKRVLEAAKSMKYRANLSASNLPKRRSRTIGVIVPKLNSNFVSSVLSGIETTANKSGYNLIISQSQEDGEKEMMNANTMFGRRVDGLVVSLALGTKNLDHFTPFFDNNIPVIFFDRVDGEKSFNNSTNIVIDNFKAGYRATNHLLEQGCQRIAHITGSLSRNVYIDRLNGFKQSLRDKNIEPDEELIFVTDLGEESAKKAAHQILNMSPMPDAVFVTNDSCAAVCMQVFKDSGVDVPNDIAVVGFNNDLISRVVEPKLTTVDYPGQEMGSVVAQNLINYLEGTVLTNITNTIVIKSQLILRGSSSKKMVDS